MNLLWYLAVNIQSLIIESYEIYIYYFVYASVELVRVFSGSSTIRLHNNDWKVCAGGLCVYNIAGYLQ